MEKLAKGNHSRRIRKVVNNGQKGFVTLVPVVKIVSFVLPLVQKDKSLVLRLFVNLTFYQLANLSTCYLSFC